jgi:unsaturated rhamnogalacturonyl hydrolase
MMKCAAVFAAGTFISLSFATAAATNNTDFAGGTPLQWSVRLADSEMARRGDQLNWKEHGAAKWDYTTGLFALALLELSQSTREARFRDFSERTLSSFITADGQIHGYRAEEYQLDHLNPGRALLTLYQLTGDKRYAKAAALLRYQLKTQPRTSDGGFWHKQRYPYQMWLDGIYMAAPFYARYAAEFHEPDSAFDDVALQIRLAAGHTYDPATGLYYHGWDEKKQQDWANKTTGTSSNFWGRAMGWYGMALVDVLDYFPANHPARPEIIATLRTLCNGLVKYQDPQTGLWYQVVDQGKRKGNYLEASCSSMFVYTLAKGVNRDYLPRDFESAAVRGYRGLVEKLIRTDAPGRVSLTQCCAVAGLGQGRDGSYEYYLREPVVDNDLKGIGPFILSGIEVQRLLSPR